MKQLSAAITAVGGWLPKDKLTNQDLEKMVDTSDEWITTRTGIKERRILKEKDRGTSYMASRAVLEMCEKIDLHPKEIDVIICATATPDMGFVSTANIVSSEIGATNALSFDLAAACTGFVYALETGSNFIKSGNYKKVVVIGADKMSSVMNYKDRTSCVLFGDGAACVLLEPNEDGFGVQDAVLKTDGDGQDLLRVKLGGSAYPITKDNYNSDEKYFYQAGPAVFKHAVTKMADAAVELIDRNDVQGDDIDWLVPHQANMRIIDATVNRVGMRKDRVTINIERYGNTTGATIPLCLWEWEKQFKKGDNLLLCAFGGGFTWGALYLKWAYSNN